MHVLRLAGILLALLFIGCSSDDGTKTTEVVPGKGQLGDACIRSEDCRSTVCVEMTDGTGVCSLSCSDSADVCPHSGNWECVRSTSYPIDVCACLKLGEREECGDGLDNDCNGVADDCRICDGVAVPNDDPNHCGACGQACNRGQTCEHGKCLCPEALPDDCGGCTSTKSDGLNCGACGTRCGPGQQCVDGSCKCPEGSSFCEGVGCVDPSTSQDHCGTCGTSCSLGRSCKDKVCTCPTAGKSFCEGVGCIDLTADNAHCGTCGTACASDKVCNSGVCTCPEGKTDCNGSCVDVQTNKEHCGACSKACGKVQACVGGICGCTELGRTVCGEECADTKTDVKHCGACGKTCATGEVCTNGACSCSSGLYCNGACIAANDATNCGTCGKICGSGQVCSQGVCSCLASGLNICGDQCVSQLSDEANCGACGHGCEPGQTCVSGTCSCFSSDQSYCAEQDACVYLVSDPKNCGACGNACKTGQYCSGGKCICPYSGQSYCSDTDGCVSVSSSNQHCGTCGNACRTGETCSYGTCKCPAGQTYCESAKACVSLTSDVANCGTCGKTCPSSQTCQSGVCRCPYYGDQYCAATNTCADLYYDGKNCGACGKVCPTGTQCSSASCRCLLSSQTLCGDSCRNLSTDAANCGTCGKTCASNQVCTNGSCQCQAPTVGTPVRLTNNALHEAQPSAAWDGTHIGLAYTQAINTTGYSQIRFALLNPDGTLVSDAAITSYTGTSEGVTSPPELIWNGTEYALTWIAYSSGTQVFFLRLDETGTPKGTAVNVASATSLGFTPSEHHLAWSGTYKGYAIVTAWREYLAFRRIGADATTLETPNLVTRSNYYGYVPRKLRMVVAPDDTWGVASGDGGGVRFTLFNADGSRTLSPATLSTSVYSSSMWPSLIHDGKAWLTAWVASSGRDILVNRGSMSSVLGTLVTSASTNGIGDVQLTKVGSNLAVGWTETTGTTSSSLYRYRVQRFTLPTSTFTVTPALHAAVDVLATENIQSTGDVALVSTGTGLLAIWADNRWGTREMYAAVLDLGSCQ